MLRLRMRLRNWNSVFAALFGHSRNGTEMYLCAAISFTEPIPAIAERYGLTVNNITVILSRTRKKLKVELTKEGYL